MKHPTKRPALADGSTRIREIIGETTSYGEEGIFLDQCGIHWASAGSNLYRLNGTVAERIFGPAEVSPFLSSRTIAGIEVHPSGIVAVQTKQPDEVVIIWKVPPLAESAGARSKPTPVIETSGLPQPTSLPPPQTATVTPPPVHMPAELSPTEIKIVSQKEEWIEFDFSLKGAPPKTTFSYRLDQGKWVAAEGANLKLDLLFSGKHEIEVEAVLKTNATRLVGKKTALSFEVKVGTPSEQMAKWIGQLAQPDEQKRAQIIQTLREQPEVSKPLLQTARESADDDLKWWIDVVLQGMKTKDK